MKNGGNAIFFFFLFFCNATLRISSQPLIVFCKPDYPTGLISLIPASTWHEKIPADC